MQSNTLTWLPSEVSILDTEISPISTFLLKISSRCNLDCSYCYVYHSPDQSWLEKPQFMSRGVVSKLASRISEYACRHNLEEVTIILHGGEPLLAGVNQLEQYFATLNNHIACKVDFAVQTNGTLLNEDLLNLFFSYNVKIGISLDGDKETNDTNRTYSNGKGSFDNVKRSIELINSSEKWQGIFGGILTVVNLDNSPERIYQTFIDLGINSVDLLLPDSNHESPPLRPIDDYYKNSYGKWLADFFDIWYGGSTNLEIRFFEEIISLLLNGASTTESIGSPIVDFVVIESDGSIEPVDTLKVVGRRATDLGMDIFSNSLDEITQHPAIYSRMLGEKVLCSTCKNCKELVNCGGGYIPHRYSEANGFLNPSVYCNDLQYIITHIRNKLYCLLGTENNYAEI